MSPTPSELLAAIRFVETGGEDDPNNARGEDGELGCMQITEPAWLDAVHHDPEIGGKFKDVTCPKYSAQIFWAYMDRYAPRKGWRDRVRIWNGGPYGDKKRATLPYLRKVEDALRNL